MEDKKGYKISLKWLMLLILMMALIIGIIVMGFIIYKDKKELAKGNAAQNPTVITDKTFSEEKLEPKKEIEVLANITANSITNAVNNNVQNVAVENTVTGTNEDGTVKKNVETMPYIYDAQYQPENITVTSYETTEKQQCSVSDIKLPYINVASNDASIMNVEIENLYKTLVNEFRICSQNLNSYVKANYETYITSNIYSVVITVTRGQEGQKNESHFAYNFDIITGLKLDYNQVCYIAGINNASENVRKTINELPDYKNYYLVEGGGVSKADVDTRNSEIEACKSRMFTIYQENLLNNKVVYFLDNNLKLNIEITVILPRTNDTYNKLIIIEA